jgi:hypothetical protein
VLTAPLLVGCGGDEDESGLAAAPSPAEFYLYFDSDKKQAAVDQLTGIGWPVETNKQDKRLVVIFCLATANDIEKTEPLIKRLAEALGGEYDDYAPSEIDEELLKRCPTRPGKPLSR